jgi:hypothetical protein
MIHRHRFNLPILFVSWKKKSIFCHRTYHYKIDYGFKIQLSFHLETPKELRAIIRADNACATDTSVCIANLVIASATGMAYKLPHDAAASECVDCALKNAAGDR